MNIIAEVKFQSSFAFIDVEEWGDTLILKRTTLESHGIRNGDLVSITNFKPGTIFYVLSIKASLKAKTKMVSIVKADFRGLGDEEVYRQISNARVSTNERERVGRV